MADNVTITAGTGTSIAADDVSGIMFQRVKVCHGADGTATDVSSASPMPVSSADLGAQADSSASSDTGTFSLIALIKRLLTKVPALGQSAMAASLPVAIASDQGNLPVATAGLTQTGTMAALNATVVLAVAGMAGAAIDIRGTYTGTVSFQGTIDGTNWFTLQGIAVGSGANTATSVNTTSTGGWYLNCAGCTQIRTNMTAYTSGTATAVMRGVTATPWVYQAPVGSSSAISGTLSAGTNAIGDVGVQYRTNSTGAASVTSVLSPATPAATAAKASAGRLLGWSLVNSHAIAIRSVKFWNTAAGSVTLGTTSAIFEIDLQPGQRTELHLPGGIAFSTAITFAVTGAKGLTDNTAITLNDVSGALFYA